MLSIGAEPFQTSQEMELLHKMLFYSILYYLWREWKVKLVLLKQQCCVFAQNVAAPWKARLKFQLRNRSKLIFLCFRDDIRYLVSCMYLKYLVSFTPYMELPGDLQFQPFLPLQRDN